MYSDIITKINTILEGLKTDGKVSEIHLSPTSEFEGYPAVVFFPTDMGNDFETTQENMKTYNFSLFLILGATQSTVKKIYTEVMPSLNDAVLEAFDEGWDLDNINGHRAWTRIETGSWNTSQTQDGLVVDATYNIEVKVLTNN